jgi:hypothetical protein
VIDEMTNPALISYIKGSEDSTEAELELADRLSSAVEEIELLTQTIARLEAANG